ncbi:MAG TPA: hypothetical protein VE666_18470 [Mycobacterium sp.]|nr:hypothetical protein [Mycobacterium sp.]
MLVALIAAWLTVAVFWAHLATGLLLIALIALHLSTRRRLPLRGVGPRRGLAYGLFIVAATAMAATGLLRWAGVPHQYAWHGGISYLVLGLAAVQLWSVRRALLARIRTHRREHDPRREGSIVMREQRFDTVVIGVIGAGQAGLAVGFYLVRQRRSFIIVDAGEQLGHRGPLGIRCACLPPHISRTCRACGFRARAGTCHPRMRWQATSGHTRLDSRYPSGCSGGSTCSAVMTTAT